MSIAPPLNDKALASVASSVPLQPLIWPELSEHKLEIYLRRDDLISNTYSGNKFYKLYYNIAAMIEAGQSAVLSYGGPYSNHLYALAALGQELGIKTIGVIRGPRPSKFGPTLRDLEAWGMELIFIDRQSYRCKSTEALPQWLQHTIARDEIAVIPEGGANQYGVRGAAAIAQAVAEQVNQGSYTFCSATATGTTLAGLVAGSPKRCQNIGFSVLKGEDTITKSVERALAPFATDRPVASFSVKTGFHCGGYAQVNEALLAFIQRFEANNSIQLDPVYTAKMLYGIEQLALKEYWPEGSRIIALHSGGLQGRRGYPALV